MKSIGSIRRSSVNSWQSRNTEAASANRKQDNDEVHYRYKEERREQVPGASRTKLALAGVSTSPFRAGSRHHRRRNDDGKWHAPPSAVIGRLTYD
jgi:hypothetical protein